MADFQSVVTYFDLSKSILVPDERTVGWFLMEPAHMLATAAGYLICILLGKAAMKNAKGFDLWGIRVFHNAVLTALSLFMTIEIIHQAALTSFYGPIVKGEKGLGMAKVLHLYYISKVVEFNDTFIMIFRKKFEQISFLHVYHHVTVLFMWWFNVYYYPGGEAYPSAWLNSFVHVWMYSYYLLSTMGYEVWWKRFLTQLQISQLSLFVIQGISLLFTGASEFKFIGLINGIYASTLVVLFLNFYRQSYNERSRQMKSTNTFSAGNQSILAHKKNK